METLLTTDIATAAEILKNGGLVAFPTETVYGLGADAFNDEAVRKIFAAKGRPADNPLIVHIGDAGYIADITSALTGEATLFIEHFFPGALTIVAKSSGRVSPTAAAGLDTVAFRMPANKIARELIKQCGRPIVAPSANLSGRPSPTTWQAVFEDMNGRIDCILQGEATLFGIESTVVDCTGDVPILLRSGGVSLEQLQSVVPQTRLMIRSDGGETKSPGLRHRHYSPNAKVVIVNNANEAVDVANSAFIGFDAAGEEFLFIKICKNAEAYARELFAFFRECDARGIKKIYCQSVAKDGIGLALMDRIGRAAE